MILKYLKYLPAVFAWKDVSNEVKIKTGQDKPFYLRQRFWGLAGAAGSITAASAWGIEIDKVAVNQAVDSLNMLSQAIYQIYFIVRENIIPSVITLYTSIMIVKGQYDAMMRKKLDGQINGKVDQPLQ